jgi:DNA-binding NarL/FixJ family response regulator
MVTVSRSLRTLDVEVRRRVTSVLLVDDDDDLRVLLRVTLTEQGFDIVGEARDGLEGVEQAARLQPDVIVLDLTMPTMDGVTVLPLLAEVAAASPVVVLSAQADEHLRARVAELGARGFVLKPTTTAHLADVLMDAKNGGPKKAT